MGNKYNSLKTRRSIQMQRDKKYQEILNSFKNSTMEEVNKGIDDIMENSEKSDNILIDPDKDIEEAKKNAENITDKEIEEFKVPDIPESYLNTLSTLDNRIYTIGKKLSEGLSVEDFNPLEFKSVLFSVNLEDLNSDNVGLKNQAIEQAKKDILFLAYNIYIVYENKTFANNMVDLASKTYAENIADKFFTSNAKMYGYDIENKTYTKYIKSEEDNEEELGSSCNNNIRESYAESITNKKFIEYIKSTVDDDFIKTMIKRCNNQVKYKRCKDSINTFIQYYLEYISNDASFISSCKSMDKFLERVIINCNSNYKSINEKYDGILSKSIVYVLSKRVFNETVSNMPFVFWVYMFNLNLTMLNCNGTKVMNPYIKDYFDSIHLIVDILYNKLAVYYKLIPTNK